MADPAARLAPALPPPGAPTRIIGRIDALTRIALKLSQRRFVTIVGPGGLGKTTVARACAVDLRAAYPDGVYLVELAPLDSPDLLPSALLAAFGISAAQGDQMRCVAGFLASRQGLVILDGCERILAAAAAAAEAMRAASAGLSILATSREALRADGEWVHSLSPMTLPGTEAIMTSTQALSFTSVQLFVDRAVHADPGFELPDDQAQRVCELCRRLDGIPLAIELAAARVPLLGIEGLAAQIGDRLAWRDDAARPPARRHRTLAETLDWSYDLLSETEQVVLRRISVFRGSFSIEAAAAVVAGDRVAEDAVLPSLMNLQAKSLLSLVEDRRSQTPPPGRYRLLDTTREYAFRKLQADPGAAAVSGRHARFLCGLLSDLGARWGSVPRSLWLREYSPWLDDVRFALNWSLQQGDDPATLVSLAVGGYSLARQLGMEVEFQPRIAAALRLLRSASPRRPSLEMALNTCLNTQGQRLRAHEIAQVDALASALGEHSSAGNSEAAATVASGIAMMSGLWGGAAFRADYVGMNEWFTRIDKLARESGAAPALLTADRIRAQVLHFSGAHAMAARVAKRILEGTTFRIPFAYNPSPIDLRVSMRIILGRALWMQGSPGRAFQVIGEGMRHARNDSPLSQCQMIALGALPIALWSGNPSECEELIALLRERAAQCSIGRWDIWADAYADVAAGRPRTSIVVPPANQDSQGDGAQLADHLCTLCPGGVTARHVQRVLQGEAGWCAPEVLRAHAANLLADNPCAQAQAEAERLLRQSLDLARLQGALAWELRATVTLAQLFRGSTRAPEGSRMLSAACGRFKDSMATRDLVQARAFLSALAAD